MLGIALDLVLLQLDFLQVGQRDRRHVAHRLEPAMAATLAVAKSHRGLPVRCAQGLRQHRLDALDQGFGPLQQALEGFVHGAGLSCGSRR